MRLLASGLLFLAIAAVAGCTEQRPATPTTASMVNEQCPIMGGEVTEDGGRFDWDGKTVGFCCPGCIDKFEALTDEEKTVALAKADDAHDGHEHANDAAGDNASEASS